MAANVTNHPSGSTVESLSYEQERGNLPDNGISDVLVVLLRCTDD